LLPFQELFLDPQQSLLCSSKLHFGGEQPLLPCKKLLFELMRKVSLIKPSKPKKNAKRKK